MDERLDARIPPPMERLGGPEMEGGAFRRIPIVPVVALVTFFLGLAAGFGLASKTQPAASEGPSASIAASGSASESAVSSGPAFGPTLAPTPPPGYVTLGQAITAAKEMVDFDDSQIVSATLVDPDRWVWEIVVEEPGEASCFATPDGQPLLGPPAPDSPVPSGSISAPSSAASASPTVQLCTGQWARIDIDYLTGLMVSLELGGTSVP